MNYWILTDTHFGHDKMQLPEYCDRPGGFEEKILANVLQIVQPTDVLIHIGDFCWYKDEYWHHRFMGICHGKHWLIRGNHDKKSQGWYLSHGWDFVGEEIILNVYGKRVALSHRPIIDRDDFDINLHGHWHNNMHHPEDGTSDRNQLLYIEHDYTPVSLRKLVERG